MIDSSRSGGVIDSPVRAGWDVRLLPTAGFRAQPWQPSRRARTEHELTPIEGLVMLADARPISCICTSRAPPQAQGTRPALRLAAGRCKSVSPTICKMKLHTRSSSCDACDGRTNVCVSTLPTYQQHAVSKVQPPLTIRCACKMSMSSDRLRACCDWCLA